jgi:hypothetical protein
MALLTVLVRNRMERKLVVECPNPTCRHPWGFGDAQVTKIDDGIVLLGRCAKCHTQAEVTIASLGGYLWALPVAPKS